MWPYPWTHVGTPSQLGHMDRVAATMSSQAHAGAAQEAPDIGQWEGQDVPLVRPSSCNVKGGIPSSRRYLPTYLLRWCGMLPIYASFVCSSLLFLTVLCLLRRLLACVVWRRFISYLLSTRFHTPLWPPPLFVVRPAYAAWHATYLRGRQTLINLVFFP